MDVFLSKPFEPIFKKFLQHQYNQNQTEVNIYHSIDVILLLLCITIAAIGIIANILVLLLTTLDKTLHKPTFTAIGALSIADLFCLCTFLIYTLEPSSAYYNYDIVMFVFSISSLHVLLIAIISYSFIHC